MKTLLVTGADGFVGRWLVRQALADGWRVVAAIGPGGAAPEAWLPPTGRDLVTSFELDLLRAEDLGRVAAEPVDAVVHLAAISSGAHARQHPDVTRRINVDGAVALLDAVAAARPRVLFISTGEVYGAGHDGPIDERAAIEPVAPYAASKAAAETALRRGAGEIGLELLIARAFPHSGPGQSPAFVLPAFAARIRDSARQGQATIAVGNLDVIRDFLDVRDVVRAYLLLLDRGAAGEAYNVASGIGRSLTDCIRMLAEMAGTGVTPQVDAALVRPADIPVLIGDATKLATATDWRPTISFEQTLRDLLDAQAD